MKRFFALFLVLLSFTGTVYADTIDLSGMTYEELVSLKEKINLAIWESQEWQEVTVPQGVWKVGEDIPAGHWTIKAAGGMFTFITIGTILDETKRDISYDGIRIAERIDFPYSTYDYDPMESLTEADFELQDGMYIVIDYASAIFTPYAGKPSLGFK